MKNPNNTNYIYRYAYNLELNQKNDLANEFYQKFIWLKISDDKELLTHGIGIIHAKRGLWDKALKAYKDQENQLEEATPASLYEKMAYAFGRLYLWEESAIEYKKLLIHCLMHQRICILNVVRHMKKLKIMKIQ